MTLPPKRQRPRSGILRAPERVWPRHRRFVRSHACCVPGCETTPIEFAHVRSAANAGTRLKPHDAFAVSLCAEHHREQHVIGTVTFEVRHGINLAALAAEFTAKSPDKAMRESLREAAV